MNIEQIQMRLYKKFSFGIVTSIDLREYKRLIEKFGRYIKSVYFSLPCGNEFHTRKKVKEEYSVVGVEKKLYEILMLMKQYNIELEVVINQYNISKSKLIQGLNFLNEYIDIDSICCLDDYLYDIKKFFPNVYLISSFNNLKKSTLDIKNTRKEYNQIVVGKQFLRDVSLFNSINKYGFENKLLLNNGCLYNCFSCRHGSELCKEIFIKNLRKHSIQELFAFQSFFPWELHKLIGLNIKIDEIKISNRPCTYKYLNDCLESYINGYEEKYILENKENFYLWGRLAHFLKYYKCFDLEDINSLKKAIWNNEISY